MFARLAFALVAIPCLAFAADAGGGAAKPPQPAALIGLLAGENRGKRMVRV